VTHLTVSVEYAIHSLPWMTAAGNKPLSSHDLAEFLGISHSFLAKIFPKLENAGIVRALEGVRGGYTLACAPEYISFLQIVDAIEGRKPLFDGQDIRGHCALFGTVPPGWAAHGVCSVHNLMLQTEKAMRDTLASHSLAALGRAVAGKAPADFPSEVQAWPGDRTSNRGGKSSKDAALSPSNREVPS
jgi:Rrf2 family protein